MKYLYYALTAIGLAFTLYIQFRLPYVHTSLIVALLYASIWAAVLWFTLRKHKGTLWGILLGIACTGFAIEFNDLVDDIQAKFQLQWLDAAGFAPLNEETLKFVGVVLICSFIIKPQRTRDFIFVGISVGMGFAIVEDCEFIARNTITSLDSDRAGAISMVLIRSMGNPFSHALFTGIAAFGLSRKHTVGWWLLACGVHAFGNLFPSLHSTFPDTIWPTIAEMCVLAAKWVATVTFIVILKRQSRCAPGSSRRSFARLT